MTELLAPAGDHDKLATAWRFGADAAYMGLEGLSLRTRTGSLDSSNLDQLIRLRALFPGRNLYLAANKYLHEGGLDQARNAFPLISELKPDALICADLGAWRMFHQEFPSLPLHLSTQAITVNSEAIKVYRDLGFSRVILGRECSLGELEAIRKAVPDIELEVFVHGAMCMAVSGRCFLSAAMSGRSANEGDCAHSCRWHYKAGNTARIAYLEEEERPGEFLPLIEEQGYTTLLSSRDLCMIDHVRDLTELGIDSLKIEGRMKSEFYVAMVTRAYRKVLDGHTVDDEIRIDLERFSHREYSTGFFFGTQDISLPALGAYQAGSRYLGLVREVLPPDPAWIECAGPGNWHRLVLDVRNPFTVNDPVVVSTPGGDLPLPPGCILAGASSQALGSARSGLYAELYSPLQIAAGSLLSLPRSTTLHIEP